MDEIANTLKSQGGRGWSYDPEATYVSVPSSQESEESTSDSSGPVCASCGNAKPTSTGDRCCDETGPMSSAMRTWQMFAQNQRDEVRLLTEVGALTAEPGMKQQTYIFSAEDSPARISPSPADEQDSKASDPPSSSSSHESLTLFAPAGSSLRTFPDSFPLSVDAISESFSRRWPSSGMAFAGECWTLDTSESPSGAVESSLSAILEPEVPSRFFLSSKAARGILRRAEKRGRQLPSHLSAALAAVARTITTGREDA